MVPRFNDEANDNVYLTLEAVNKGELSLNDKVHYGQALSHVNFTRIK